MVVLVWVSLLKEICGREYLRRYYLEEHLILSDRGAFLCTDVTHWGILHGTLRSGYCSSLYSYLSKNLPDISSICPACDGTPYDTNHLSHAPSNPLISHHSLSWIQPIEQQISWSAIRRVDEDDRWFTLHWQGLVLLLQQHKEYFTVFHSIGAWSSAHLTNRESF